MGKQISKHEFMMLVQDLRVSCSIIEREKIFHKADKNYNGTIDFHEFVDCVIEIVSADWATYRRPELSNIAKGPSKELDNGDEDGEDEMPEDLASLDPAEQQRRVKKRAFTGMGVGTLLVLVFSDPMCDMLGVIGDKCDISKFYVAFVLAPLASNASELIAAM